MSEPEHKFKRGDVVRVLGQKVTMTVLGYNKDGDCRTLWFLASGDWKAEGWCEDILEIIPYPDQPYRDV